MVVAGERDEVVAEDGEVCGDGESEGGGDEKGPELGDVVVRVRRRVEVEPSLVREEEAAAVQWDVDGRSDDEVGRVGSGGVCEVEVVRDERRVGGNDKVALGAAGGDEGVVGEGWRGVGGRRSRRVAG